MSGLERSRYASSVREDGALLADAGRANLDAPVPSCPGWSVADLLEHTGSVHRKVTERVRTGRLERAAPDIGHVPTGPALVEWFAEGVERLASVLPTADPSLAVWTWSKDHTAGFWQRRMAHETAVHRWDGQNAAGEPAPIAADLAADGVDEWLDVFVPAEADEKPLTGDGERVHLHGAGGGEWLLTLQPDGLSVDRTHDGADVSVSGSSSDLVLMLWRRVGPDQLQVEGDRSLLDRFLAWMDLS